MMRRFRIFVEGDADKKFLSDYYQHIFQKKAPMNSIIHTGELEEKTGGYKKLTNEVNIREMRINSDQGGVNLVIFDADQNLEAKRRELLSYKEDYGLEFELFLFPNNQDPGELEDLLENIINPNNHSIFECWEHYEQELVTLNIPGRTPPPLTTPAKKTKIYGYLEALLFKNQKEQIKEKKRDYEIALHWNLDAEYLEPLKVFLKYNIENNK